VLLDVACIAPARQRSSVLLLLLLPLQKEPLHSLSDADASVWTPLTPSVTQPCNPLAPAMRPLGLGMPSNYSFVKRLGRGTQGDVWLAVDSKNNELVAVKVRCAWWAPDAGVSRLGGCTEKDWMY